LGLLSSLFSSISIWKNQFFTETILFVIHNSHSMLKYLSDEEWGLFLITFSCNMDIYVIVFLLKLFNLIFKLLIFIINDQTKDLYYFHTMIVTYKVALKHIFEHLKICWWYLWFLFNRKKIFAIGDFSDTESYI
jgi:hypothetical protein